MPPAIRACRGAACRAPARNFLPAPVWPAVEALCEQPGLAWTVEALAERLHLSCSAFADRFQIAAGSSSIEFLTLWRIYLAQGWLEQERLPIAMVAERCGYQSEAAFSKAFKRVVRNNPGEFRRRNAGYD